jgi:hypothetical protein
MSRFAPPIILLAAFSSMAMAADDKPTKQQAPAEMATAADMSQDKENKESWTYRKEGLDFKPYASVLIDPTAVYTGADAQFGKISASDQAKYADIFTTAMNRELGKVLPVVGQPGPGVLRVKMTLIGLTMTQGGLATVTRVTPIGFAMSTVKSVVGKKGTFTGSMLYGMEVTDAATGEVLVAAVRRTAPDALDIGSTLSMTDSVQSVTDKVAKDYRDRLKTAQGK